MLKNLSKTIAQNRISKTLLRMLLLHKQLYLDPLFEFGSRLKSIFHDLLISKLLWLAYIYYQKLFGRTRKSNIWQMAHISEKNCTALPWKDKTSECISAVFLTVSIQCERGPTNRYVVVVGAQVIWHFCLKHYIWDESRRTVLFVSKMNVMKVMVCVTLAALSAWRPCRRQTSLSHPLVHMQKLF